MDGDKAIVNLVKKAELDELKSKNFTEIKDGAAKTIFLQKLAKSRDNYRRYTAEKGKLGIEKSRDISAIILSLAAAAISVFLAIRAGEIAPTIAVLFIYLAFIVYVMHAYFRSYTSIIITEYFANTGSKVNSLMKHFDDRWIIFGNQAVPRSLLGKHLEARYNKMEKIAANIAGQFPETSGIRNTINAVDFNAEKLKTMDKKLKTTLYLENYGWTAMDKNMYMLHYYAYDHTGIIGASETITLKRRYPELQKSGFYTVTCKAAASGSTMKLEIFGKEPVRVVAEHIVQPAAKGM